MEGRRTDATAAAVAGVAVTPVTVGVAIKNSGLRAVTNGLLLGALVGARAAVPVAGQDRGESGGDGDDSKTDTHAGLMGCALATNLEKETGMKLLLESILQLGGLVLYISPDVKGFDDDP